MDYQLTLKFPYFDVDDYKNLIKIEEKLIEKLGDSATFDGHYAGPELMNIFIITSKPLETFVIVLGVVKSEDLLSSLSVVCRAVNGHKYAQLWPLKLQESFDTR